MGKNIQAEACNGARTVPEPRYNPAMITDVADIVDAANVADTGDAADDVDNTDVSDDVDTVDTADVVARSSNFDPKASTEWFMLKESSFLGLDLTLLKHAFMHESNMHTLKYLINEYTRLTIAMLSS